MPVLNGHAVLHAIAALPKAAADLVLPPSCPGCGAAVADWHALCPNCWSQIRFIEPPLCPVYGSPFACDAGKGVVSPEAIADPPPFRRARAAVVYADVARRLVHQVKYHDRPDLVHVMAKAMHRAGRESLLECEVIVPVPLYRWRLWQRRFNQAALLSERLSELSGLLAESLVLRRIRPTRRQVGLTASQRQVNVRGAFEVDRARSARIAGRAVLLVDDVYTSGATAKAASRALLGAGAASVDVLTFARVVL